MKYNDKYRGDNSFTVPLREDYKVISTLVAGVTP